MEQGIFPRQQPNENELVGESQIECGQSFGCAKRFRHDFEVEKHEEHK